MKRDIVINATDNESRIAITEDEKLVELYVDRPEKERVVGNIYLGRVKKVLPGIKAAFIDIGFPQDAFLHFSDISDSMESYNSILSDETEIDDDSDDEEQSENNKPKNRNRNFKSPKNLKTGQDIIVQITKEPVGNKGVRVTTEVSLPGRYLVLLPFDNNVGVSKRIQSFKEKKRLRKLIKSDIPDGFGAILRTNAETEKEEFILNDLKSLVEKWREIEKNIKDENPPALLYKDATMTSTVLRDIFSDSINQLIVDNKKIFKDIKNYVKENAPAMMDKIELYTKRVPIFDEYGIEKEIAKSLSRKVWLKSGGYIIVEHTEAMTVVDVNSGRYAAKQEQELNSLKTNLEAAREAARQIRLRDLGGIIVIDFIDLTDDKNRKKIYDEMKKEFHRDKTKSTIYPLTDLCIMQITRQRIRQSIMHSFSEPCNACGGAGFIPSKSTIVGTIERWLRRFCTENKEWKIVLTVHPHIAAYLNEGTIRNITKLKWKYKIFINLIEEPSLAIDEFKVYSPKQDRDITEAFAK